MNFERIKKLSSLYNVQLWNVEPGQEVEIHEKIKEGNNERIWRFRGLIIKVKKPNLHDGTFTVRGKVLGIDVEKVYPLSSTSIEKIILLDKKRIRRAKLYYIRDKVGKKARLKSLLQGEKSSQRGREIGKRNIIVTENNTQKQEEKVS